MSNMIRAERFPDVVDDNGICDVARISFKKLAANFPPEQNKKLVNHLTKHRHWSPSGQARFTVYGTLPERYVLDFLCTANLAGFKFNYSHYTGVLYLNGSIWAFLENRNHLPFQVFDTALNYISKNFPWFAESWELSSERQSSFQSSFQALSPNSYKVGVPETLWCASLKGEAPIYVVRQLGKHQVGLTWNEISRRYVDEAPEHYDVDAWRARPGGSIKQGSGSPIPEDRQKYFNERVAEARKFTDGLYEEMKLEIAPEQARSVLMQDMQTEWVWTGALSDFARMCRERLPSDAQKESRIFAEQVYEILSKEFGSVWTRMV